MPISPGGAGPLLEPGLREIFAISMGSRPSPMLSALFGERDSKKASETYQAMGENALVPPFNGTVAYDAQDLGYTTVLLNYEFAKGMVVERKLLDDDQYNIIRGRAESLGDSVPNTIESDAADIFINGFTDSGTNRFGQSTNGADGVALMSTAHPDSPINTGSTQSNEGTLALNLPNLDTTRQAMMNFTDDRGNLMGVNPDMLVVPTELERTATQIISQRALYEPGSAQFDVNMFAGRLRPIVWNRLTDANAWFLMDSRLLKQHLIWQWRVRPEFAQDGDFDGIQLKFRAYMRYSIGWRDWRFIFGQNPA